MKREVSMFALSGALLLGGDAAPVIREQTPPALGCAVLAMHADNGKLKVKIHLEGFEPRHVAGKANLWFSFPHDEERYSLDGSPAQVSQRPDNSLEITSTHSVRFEDIGDSQATSSGWIELNPEQSPDNLSGINCDGYQTVTFEHGVPVKATPLS